MNYETAKANFEAVVTRMQEDLKADANNPRVSARALDSRLWIVNALVDYFNMSEKLLQDMEWQMLNTDVKYQNLNVHTQKLVYWAKMHQVNVSAIDHYGFGELEDLVKRHIDFTSPFVTDEESALIFSKYILVLSCYGRKKSLMVEKPPKPTAEQIKASCEWLSREADKQLEAANNEMAGSRAAQYNP